MDSIVDRSQYTLNIPYLISRYIREYDISKANINILLRSGYIDKEMYDYIYNMEKKDREVFVGNMILQDRKVQDILSSGIHEMRKKFVTTNNILEQDILSIKNDALYLIDKIPSVTKFDNVEFRLANIYTSYIKLGKLEIYYYNNIISNEEVIDVKGIRDSKLEMHTPMLTFICSILQRLECGDLNNLFSYFTSFVDDYIRLKLEVEYYRQFNSEGKYVSKQIGMNRYKFDMISQDQLDIIDISYNLNVLRELYRIMLNVTKNK